MDNSNQKTVFVVFNDTRKDMSKAERFGRLKDVFSSVGRNYNADALIAHARHVLEKADKGDCLLLVGDPTLCGICMTVLSEYQDAFEVLRWDRDRFDYFPLMLKFYGSPNESLE